MTSMRIRALLLAVATTSSAVVGLAAPASASASPSSELAKARAATAAFHDPKKAEAAGYLPTEECVAVPGLGVMGQHWVNPALFTADARQLDPTKPQALLYVPTGDGGVRLVAVEYIVLAPGQQVAANPDQVDPNGPALFGQHFNGVMAGHFPGMPNHWDLHTWIWSHNPGGTFSQFNSSSSLSC